MARWVSSSTALAVLLLSSALASGCAAVFPEMETRMSAAPAGVPLDPPPPDDRHFVAIVSGKVPPRTRDGRAWDQVFGSLPDPYVRLKVNGAEILKTIPASDTLEPTWPTSPKGNFPIAVGDTIEIELWDSSAFNDTPIGLKKFELTPEQLSEGEIEVDLSNEATVTMHLGPARAVWGAGFWYDLRNGSSYVTRLVDGSPAFRAGMRAGDRILTLQGKPVEQMSPDEVRSILGAIPAAGVAMTLQHDDGATLSATVKEGPIYPLQKDVASLPVKPE